MKSSVHQSRWRWLSMLMMSTTTTTTTTILLLLIMIMMPSYGSALQYRKQQYGVHPQLIGDEPKKPTKNGWHERFPRPPAQTSKIGVSPLTRIAIGPSEFKDYDEHVATWTPTKLHLQKSQKPGVAVDPNTHIEGTSIPDHWSPFDDTDGRPQRFPRLREQLGDIASKGRLTTVLDVDDYYGNSTAKHRIWTPNGKFPKRHSLITRAIQIARRSFIVAHMASRYTRLYVFYLDNESSLEEVKVDQIRTKKGLYPKLLSASCTGYNYDVEGYPSNAESAAWTRNPFLKVTKVRALLAALYSACKKSMLEGIEKQLKWAKEERKPEDTGLDWGILATLHPQHDKIMHSKKHGKKSSKKKKKKKIQSAPFNDVINTWFNNVDIYFEGTSRMRQMVAKLNIMHMGNMTHNLWMYVENADHYLRQNPGHVFMRVMPGTMQAYLHFLALRQWGHDHNHRHGKLVRPPITDRNIFTIGIGTASTMIAWHLGPSRVNGIDDPDVLTHEKDNGGDGDTVLDWGEDDNGGGGGGGDEEKEGGMVTVPPSSSFLQVSSTTTGPMSLVYPLANNPGTIFARDIPGAGSSRLLVETMKLQYRRMGGLVPDGGIIEMPCLAREVTVAKRSVLSPVSTVGEVVCWKNVGKSPFDHAPCVDFSFSKALVEATMKRQLRFVGTSNFKRCKDLLREVLSGYDDNLPSRPYDGSFFTNTATSQTSIITTQMRKRLKYMLFAHSHLSKVVYEIAHSGLVPGVNMTAYTFGLTMPQVRKICKQLAGRKYGQRDIRTLGSWDYMLPLLGSYIDILLLEKFDLKVWPGRAMFRDITWIDGYRLLMGSMMEADDPVYRNYYEMQRYRVPNDWRGQEEEALAMEDEHPTNITMVTELLRRLRHEDSVYYSRIDDIEEIRPSIAAQNHLLELLHKRQKQEEND